MPDLQCGIDGEINNFFRKLELPGVRRECKYKDKSLYKALAGLDSAPDYQALFAATFRQLEKGFGELARFKKSESRGRLRPFCPIGEKAVHRLIGPRPDSKGKGFEVPLERSLALVNGFYCQFSPVGGWSTSTFKRKSIDLVIDRDGEKVGVLIELKGWKGDTPLYAALELVENFMMFLLAREKDAISPPINKDSTPSSVKWPGWQKFSLCVMAPKGSRHPVAIASPEAS